MRALDADPRPKLPGRTKPTQDNPRKTKENQGNPKENVFGLRDGSSTLHAASDFLRRFVASKLNIRAKHIRPGWRQSTFAGQYDKTI
jgi:hypothetical protein